MRGFKIYVNLVLTLFACTCFAQEQCTTQESTPGICIDIKTCDPLLTLLRTQSENPSITNYLRRTLCGFTETSTLVCCPLSDKAASTGPPATQRPTGRTVIVTESARSDILKPPLCGKSNLTNLRVVGGQPVKIGEFPWIAALGYRNSKNPNMPKWLCGGALISDRHILTAGHCIHNRDDLYVVRLGDIDLYDDEDGAVPVNVPIASTKLHEDYDPISHTNDIGIITLAHKPDAPLVWPICLPFDEPLRSRNLVKSTPYVAGWGATEFRGPSSPALLTVRLPVVETDQCRQSYASFKTIIDDRVLCAGLPQGGKDTCQGDSGGPLMFGNPEKGQLYLYLIGVVSYGFRCAEPGYPGVYSRVTTFLDWIQQNMK